MPRLEQRIETNASRQSIWGLLADFGGVEKWAPGILHSRLRGEQASGVGARRVIRHRWGFRIEERVTEWTHGRGYAFELLQAPFPMREVHESWSIESRNRHTIVTTAVSYSMGLATMGTLLDHLLVKSLVEREMRAGLNALISYRGH